MRRHCNGISIDNNIDNNISMGTQGTTGHENSGGTPIIDTALTA